jgi:succinate dehydrogenase/fumarate reductase-like Fe-S protein
VATHINTQFINPKNITLMKTFSMEIHNFEPLSDMSLENIKGGADSVCCTVNSNCNINCPKYVSCPSNKVGGGSGECTSNNS